MLKIHLIPAMIILASINAMTIGFLLFQLYPAAALSATLAAMFTWANINNEVLGQDLKEWVYGKRK